MTNALWKDNIESDCILYSRLIEISWLTNYVFNIIID